MKRYDVLIVEDDAVLCEALCDTLDIEGFSTLAAHNGIEALAALEKHSIGLVVSDVQMPTMDGFQLLKNIGFKHGHVPVLLMTAYGTVPKAVQAMRDGAVDYLVKPFDASILVAKVAGIIDAGSETAAAPVAQDAVSQQLFRLLGRVADTDVAVLLQGESGTGKEVAARYIHEHSRYRHGPFIAVNCAAIPETMLEAILFGYEKGAFTGAVQSAPGKFETAQGGTLLLDEIGELALGLQAKLLRVLQEKEVERIGGRNKIELNVRILAATNQHLKRRVETGNFREDLYYRLSVFPVRIPALRERPGDIMSLALALLQRHLPNGQALPVFDRAATEKMLAYAWPGNVRELENVIQRALILKTGTRIGADDLVFEDTVTVGQDKFEHEQVSENQEAEACLSDQVRSAEEQMILQTLANENGSRKQTAEKLGISPRTLRYKLARMKRNGVELPCTA
ncbi:MAG: sigma-54-dependent transcriptional regulator [Gammaproteobacteria bacterium]